MTIDTLGYVKRFEAAGVDWKHAEALRDEIAAQIATRADLERLGDKTEDAIEKLAARFEAALWKHAVGVLLGTAAIVGLLLRFFPPQ